MESTTTLPRILTNCSPLERVSVNKKRVIYDIVRDGSHGRFARLFLFLKALFKYDAIVLHQPNLELIVLSITKRVIPFSTARLVGIDFQFSKPKQGLKGKIKGLIWYLVWSQVDLVIGHMRYNDSLRIYFGIKDNHYKYVPFKVNGIERGRQAEVEEGGYIFTGGFSWRDYGLFCEAMKRLPNIHAKIATLGTDELTVHNTEMEGLQIPPNVERIVHDQNAVSWLDLMRRATCVVLPISADAICSNGISVTLEAMVLGKAIVVTKCPAVDGIFESGRDLVIVEQGNPEALAEQIEKVWRDSQLRARLGENGKRIADSLGGVDSLMHRLSRAFAEHFGW